MKKLFVLLLALNLVLVSIAASRRDASARAVRLKKLLTTLLVYSLLYYRPERAKRENKEHSYEEAMASRDSV